MKKVKKLGLRSHPPKRFKGRNTSRENWSSSKANWSSLTSNTYLLLNSETFHHISG